MAIDVLRGPIVHAFYVTVLITHFAITEESFMKNIEELQNGSRNGDNALRSLIASFNYIARPARSQYVSQPQRTQRAQPLDNEGDLQVRGFRGDILRDLHGVCGVRRYTVRQSCPRVLVARHPLLRCVLLELHGVGDVCATQHCAGDRDRCFQRREAQEGEDEMVEVSASLRQYDDWIHN
ncbi:hypothetical protein ON010_g5750 [Phytophthora cinnamomi]|nr:hypothetical protein ON010_g5750 [Phytophthora cinnamomi]